MLIGTTCLCLLQLTSFSTSLSSSPKIMPTVPAGSKVLVTGANGFVAAWVIRTLLEQGYKVRGTIRSEGKGVHLKKIFANHGDKFELIIVEDITKVRCHWLEVVLLLFQNRGSWAPDLGSDSHIRCFLLLGWSIWWGNQRRRRNRTYRITFPARGRWSTRQSSLFCSTNLVSLSETYTELITPAVNGTVSILKSALTASTLKRFILLSSTAAVISLLPDPKPFTESDWNEQSIEDVKVNGKNANQVNKYCASKTLAEKGM